MEALCGLHFAWGGHMLRLGWIATMVMLALACGDTPASHFSAGTNAGGGGQTATTSASGGAGGPTASVGSGVRAGGEDSVVVFANVHDPRGLFLTETHAFWTHFPTGRLLSMPLDRSSEPEVHASMEVFGLDLAPLGDDIFWAIAEPFQSGHILRFDTTTNNATVIVDDPTRVPVTIAVDDSGIYWIGLPWAVDGEPDPPDVVRRYTADNGIETLVDVDAGHSELGLFIGLDDTHVYWTRFNVDGPSGVQRAKREGGEPEVVAATWENASSPYPVVVDRGAVYWINDGSVYATCK